MLSATGGIGGLPAKGFGPSSAFASIAEADMPKKVSPVQLAGLIGTADCPVIIDVRREPLFRSSETRIAGSVWRHHLAAAEWARDLPASRPVVVYCVHGHNVSALAAALLVG